jgi:hypothetical protein
VKDKGYFPTRAIFRDGRDGLLSWRVALLPYLGYDELYAQFRLNEPWNSRHNYELLAHIPSVYQSPERCDDHTNYLVPVDTNTAFGENRVVLLSSFEDGLENTAVVVEADDLAAVPWTAPREYKIDGHTPGKTLGSLRGDSFFVVWGNCQVGRISKNASPNDLTAMFTHESGEDFTAGRIDQPLFAKPSARRDGSMRAAAGDTAGERAVTSASGSDGQFDRGADAALASLAEKYRELSDEALVQGRQRDAIHWYYAAAIAGPPGGQWAERYRWVPALRRPTPCVRFGLGLDYAGPREKEVEQVALTAARHRPQNRGQAWKLVTGELGKQIVAALSSHGAENGNSAAGEKRLRNPTSQARASTKRQRLSSHRALVDRDVCFLSVAREAVLLEAARREAVDVLLVVDWRDSGHKWSAGLKLIDVLRGERLVNFQRLKSEEVTRRNPLAKDPLAETMHALNKFLDESLAMQPLPEQILPRHVARRLDSLAATNEENPLRALAEMRFYRERGLADDSQLMLAYQALLGQKRGRELMLGDAASRETLLDAWLPVPTPMIEDSVLD